MTNKRYTKKEIEFMTKYRFDYSIAEMAIKVGHPESSVRDKMNRLGYIWRNKKIQYQRAWTPEEERFLRDNYLKLTYQNLAKTLNRTLRSIEKKIYQLKLYSEKIQACKIPPTLSETDRAYIAGLIDGEGSIGFSIHYRNEIPFRIRTLLRIDLTNKVPLKWIAKKIDLFELSAKPCSVYEHKCYEKNPAHKKSVYSLHLANRLQIEPLLLAILPYLQIKREIAKELLNFYKSNYRYKPFSIQSWKSVLRMKNLIDSTTPQHIRFRQHLAQFIKELESKQSNNQ